PLYLGIANRTTQPDAVDVVERHEHRGFVGDDPQVIKAAGGAEDGLLFDPSYDAEPLVGVNDLVSDLKCHSGSPVMRYLEGPKSVAERPASILRKTPGKQRNVAKNRAFSPCVR